MKKILSILGAIGLIATTGASVTACSKTSPINYTFENDKSQLEKKGDNVVILITDYSSLTNVKTNIKPEDEAILTVTQPDTDGKVTVTAAADTGTATVTITADGKSNTEISFSIEQKHDIDATIDKSSIAVNETATITIANATQLTNLKATANPAANVNLTPINQGKITVTAKTAGNVVITLTADNGKAPKDLSLTITMAKVAIELDKDEYEVKLLNSVTITIVNIADLDKNSLTATLDSSGLNLASIDNSKIKEGTIKVASIGATGEVNVTINANNATAPKVVRILISLT